jgi:hypothetical protein
LGGISGGWVQNVYPGVQRYAFEYTLAKLGAVWSLALRKLDETHFQRIM